MTYYKKSFDCFILATIVILTSFLILPQVSALTKEECNYAGNYAGSGIYCSNLPASNNCIWPSYYTNVNYDTLMDCVVSTSQDIPVGDTYLKRYYFKSLKIDYGVSLKFYANSVSPQAALSGTCQGSCDITKALTSSAGDAGQSISGDNNKGGDGGAGGAGGGMFKAGGNSAGGTKNFDAGNCGSNCEGKGKGASGGKPGANITIYAKNLTMIDGSEISVAGRSGGNGADGGDDCGVNYAFPFCTARAGGGSGGGAGGGGGGMLSIYTNYFTLSSTAKLNVSGGSGGRAGTPGNDKGNNNDDGCFGGSGGGGESGEIKLYYSGQEELQIIPTNIFFLKGGAGGVAPDGRYCNNDPTAEKAYGLSGKDKTASTLRLTEKPSECNNGLDDDNDNLIDLQDADCYNTASTGENTFCTTKSGPLPTISLPGAKSSIASPWWNPLATNGNDGCCGDDVLDYGFISKIGSGTSDRRQYLCYNKTKPTLSSDSDFIRNTWLNAVTTRYLITSINTSKGNIDAISNSLDWYYCNATGTAKLDSGIPIRENGTFNNAVKDNTVACYELYSNQRYPIIFADNCTDAPDKPCCAKRSGTTEPVRVPIDDIEQCADYCQLSISEGTPLPPLIITDTFNEVPTNPDTASFIPKSMCPFNPADCLENIAFSKDKPCGEQGNTFSPSNTLCNSSTSICKKGISLTTLGSSPDNLCCFGSEATCVTPKPTITTQTECKYHNGTFYKSTDYSCKGSNITVTTGGICCFGTVTLSNKKIVEYQSDQNGAFRCFKQNSQNLLTQCCQDTTCINKKLLPVEYVKIVEFSNKIQSLGSVQNTILNFDRFNGTIKDYIYKLPISAGSYGYVDMMGYPNYLNISQFTFLEFDIAYNTPDLDLILNGGTTLDNIQLGKVSKFSTNGDAALRWHHIVINLTNYAPGITKFHNLKFINQNKDRQKAYILVDNIILVPYTIEDLKYNSPNYYCTGGFQGWINELDPPPSLDPTSNDWTWENYGPYQLTCDSQAAFGWTGTRCCGDDTKLDNYGEFYNDTERGCFNGSLITDNEALTYSKKIDEPGDIFEAYKYKDLLYFNDSFVTCQAADTKYTNLLKGFNGSINPSAGALIPPQTITEQCTVRGSYYCANGAWRKKIRVGATEYKEFPETQILLSTTPPGAELLKNGFRG